MMQTSHDEPRSALDPGDPERPGYRSLLVLIPSRNRSDLAMRAIRSTLDAPVADNIQVLVSDNSTEETEASALASFCAGLPEGRVRYIRPAAPLSMAKHWEWAFRRAIEEHDFSHLTLLADRRIYRRGGLHELCEIARAHPDVAIVSRSDALYDHVEPIRLYGNDCSNKLLRVRSESMLAGNAGAVVDLMTLVPTPFVSILPRRLFRQVKDRYGDYCLSHAPDYCFGYRVLNLEDSVIVYDKAMSLMLGMARSNGLSFMRGVQNKDNADFVATNGGVGFEYWATPAPGILSGWNGIFHEYNFVRSQSDPAKFPELDVPSYLKTIHAEITHFGENPERRDHYLKVLESLGFAAAPPEPAPASPPPPDAVAEGRSLLHRVRDLWSREPRRPLWKIVGGRLRSKLSSAARRFVRSPRFRPAWVILHRAGVVRLPSWLGDRGFSTVDEAIEFFNGRDAVPSDALIRTIERFQVGEVAALRPPAALAAGRR